MGSKCGPLTTGRGRKKRSSRPSRTSGPRSFDPEALDGGKSRGKDAKGAKFGEDILTAELELRSAHSAWRKASQIKAADDRRATEDRETLAISHQPSAHRLGIRRQERGVRSRIVV